MTPLPQGIRASLQIYLIDATGKQIEITLSGMKQLPETVNPVDASGLVKSCGLNLPDGDWRAMTDAEIVEYLADKENDQ